MCYSYSAEGHRHKQRKQIHPFRQWEVLWRKHNGLVGQKVMGIGDYILLSSQRWPLWGGDFWVITWMMNRKQLYEEIRERTFQKYVTSQDCGGWKEACGVRLSWAGGRMEAPKNMCLPLCSVLLSNPLLLPDPIPCPGLQDFSLSAPRSIPSKLIDFWEARILWFFESLALGKEPVLFPSCVENIELPWIILKN